ncbi:hypothetical protein ABTO68_20165, partial [Acinetobacter baumannii]
MNDAATALSLTAVPVAENVSGAVVANIAISDIDSLYGPRDVAVSGADAAKFHVIGSAGALQL